MKDMLIHLKDFEMCMDALYHMSSKQTETMPNLQVFTDSALARFFFDFQKFIKNKYEKHPEKKAIKEAYDNLHKKLFMKCKCINTYSGKSVQYPRNLPILNKFHNYRTCGHGIDKFMSKYLLKLDCCKAIRRRKSQALGMVRRRFAEFHKDRKPANILDISLGPSHIVKESLKLFPQPGAKELVNLTVVDNGDRGTNGMNSIIDYTTAKTPILNDKVLEDLNKYHDLPLNQDIIISMELFDCLDDEQFEIYLKLLYKLLNNKSSIVIGSLSNCFQNKFELEWIWNMPLYIRGIGALRRLARWAGIDKKMIIIKSDNKGMFNFLILVKE